MLTFHYHYFIETQSVFSNKSNIYKQIFFPIRVGNYLI